MSKDSLMAYVAVVGVILFIGIIGKYYRIQRDARELEEREAYAAEYMEKKKEREAGKAARMEAHNRELDERALRRAREQRLASEAEKEQQAIDNLQIIMDVEREGAQALARKARGEERLFDFVKIDRLRKMQEAAE